MNLGLKDKVILVTGSARGIGKAVALTFAEEDAKVVVADILDEGADVADKINNNGGEALFVKFDFTKLEEARRLVKETVSRFDRLDVLCNVGAAWRSNFFMQMTEEEWDFEITCVYRQVLNMCRASLEHMIDRRSGKIVNIGSDAGRVGEPNQPVYSGAKGGVIAFTKAIAKDVARYGIRANCVCPSMTMTERVASREKEAEDTSPEALEKYKVRMEKIVRMYPLRKLGTPQDVADMVVFMASERANHITGQTISVNGGYCMV